MVRAAGCRLNYLRGNGGRTLPLYTNGVTAGQGAARQPVGEAGSGPGRLLRQWRERRRMSQLGLALDAGISARHLSFIETGRAQPSREMLLRLSRVLEVPLRGRNELLAAAGFAPVYRETGLDAPGMAHARRALDFILRQQEPYPAMVLDRHWNILLTNAAMSRVMGLFLDPAAAAAAGAPNAMRLSYHPQGLRPFIVNWEATAAAFVQWLHRDLLRTGDVETRRLLDELLAYPDVPRQWRTLDLDASTAPFLAIELRRGEACFSFFTILASLGTPYDITLHELRVECFFPADEATEAVLRGLAAPPSA
jgi:transcriptional regulator with XRE-family HTH domain